MKKDRIKNSIDGFLSSEFFDSNQKNTSSKLKLVRNYELNAPYCYANILYNPENSNYMYQIDEVKLNHEEQQIYDKLYQLLEENIDSTKKNKDSNFEKFLNEIIEENKKLFQRYPVASIEKVKYYLHRDIAGFGIIDGLMKDPNIEDVSCSGINTPIYVWHRQFDSLQTNIQFEPSDLNNFVSRIVFRAGKHVSSAHPITDLALEGNHRISVLYQKEITPKGTSFTIRKFKEDPYTIIDLIDFGTMNATIAAYLWMLMESKMSIMVIGSTGSGKTTVLNAITGLVNPDYKIFSVEDVSEINIKHENWFSLISRPGFGTKGEGEIDLYSLIKSGVRHRPDYIVVGEIRGSEAYVMFQAMATGHGGLCTMHADSLLSATKRLQQKPMEIPPSYMTLMNCAIVIRRIKNNDTGQSTRKLISIEEIKDSNSFNSVFKWNPKTNSFDSNIEKSEMLKRIADSQGQSVKEIIDEYQKRVAILNWMHAHNIREYKEVSEIIGNYYRNPNDILKTIHYEV
ncbi:MAG: secretion system protein E [Nitrosopumilaceae archaeon]|nr:type II/IV secretion system ATPase subunit [Nitrosopumilaceae archaeon]NIU01988.1 type II/IV secretion system ATPase subunit [Nitrosopumilaceae archaeon]NIU87139.1 secretion system protein E [Nitrosopumilaceae archaeon]NIV64629.1 secretion system protein E [Nitrosopumilaceae archaeon]NIX62589.1 secretion system protein E [Nitrosopumilaceae archaeon]